MNKSFLLFMVLWVVLCFQIKAQYDPSFTHFWMLESQYNPAAVGIKSNLRVSGCYSNQMSGYSNNPKTMFVGLDLPLFFINKHHAGGAYIINDEIGLFSHKRFAVQYAYRMKIFSGTLSIGLQGEVLNESFDGSNLDVEDTNDPALPTSKVSGNKLDCAAGLYFSTKKIYIGVSSLHLTAPTVLMGEKNEVRVKRSYYFTAGYNIALSNPLFSIHPCTRWMYDGVSNKTDIAVRAQYTNNDKMLFAGVGYSPSNSAALFVGGKFHGVVLSYSYEAYTGGVGLGNGAHELVLSYEMKLNLEKKGKNKHQSVRLL